MTASESGRQACLRHGRRARVRAWSGGSSWKGTRTARVVTLSGTRQGAPYRKRASQSLGVDLPKRRHDVLAVGIDIPDLGAQQLLAVTRLSVTLPPLNLGRTDTRPPVKWDSDISDGIRQPGCRFSGDLSGAQPTDLRSDILVRLRLSQQLVGISALICRPGWLGVGSIGSWAASGGRSPHLPRSPSRVDRERCGSRAVARAG